MRLAVIGTGLIGASVGLAAKRAGATVSGFDDDEANVYGTNPKKADSDGDGRDDGQEVFDTTDPNNPNDL